jgi:coenzyme PQQ precursor peptide PqqA
MLQRNRQNGSSPVRGCNQNGALTQAYPFGGMNKDRNRGTIGLRDHLNGFQFDVSHLRRIDMTWETPQAIDWRFGFEITMYIANR